MKKRNRGEITTLTVLIMWNVFMWSSALYYAVNDKKDDKVYLHSEKNIYLDLSDMDTTPYEFHTKD